jgi:hypothetical protein
MNSESEGISFVSIERHLLPIILSISAVRTVFFIFNMTFQRITSTTADTKLSMSLGMLIEFSVIIDDIIKSKSAKKTQKETIRRADDRSKKLNEKRGLQLNKEK